MFLSGESNKLFVLSRLIMAGKRRTSNTPASRVAAAKKGRKSGAAALDEHDDFILDSDDERKMAKNAPEEEESDMETAEEKRLRLGKRLGPYKNAYCLPTTIVNAITMLSAW